MGINSGERAMARRWSRAIYDAFPDIHGLRYASSMTNERCYAFYDRAQTSLAPHPLFDERLSHPQLQLLLDGAVYTLGYDTA